MKNFLVLETEFGALGLKKQQSHRVLLITLNNPRRNGTITRKFYRDSVQDRSHTIGSNLPTNCVPRPFSSIREYA